MPHDDSTPGLGLYQILVIGSLALVVLSVLLLLGLAVVGGIAGGLDDTGDPLNKTASPDPEPGSSVGFEDTSLSAEILTIHQVNDSTGYGIRLTGAEDSFVESRESVTIAADDTWSVSTWAAVNSSSAGKTMTAVSANGRVLIQYNGTAGNWTAWYYDEGSRNSYRVNVSANQPANLSLVTVSSNGTHLWIYRNTTQGDVKNITTDNIANGTLNATNWHGTLDETRVFDDATTDSEQSTLYNNPVAPRDDRDRTIRIMYDEGEETSTAVYFTGGTRSDVSNVTWVRALAGNELSEGTDYEINTKQGRITAVQGGAIDDAPVVWIDYRYRPLNRVGEVAAAISGGYELFAAGAIVIPAVVALAVLLGGLMAASRLSQRVDLDDFNNRGRGR